MRLCVSSVAQGTETKLKFAHDQKMPQPTIKSVKVYIKELVENITVKKQKQEFL